MAKKSQAARIFRSAEQWRDIINQQAHSQSTIADFCSQQGVSVSGFYLWRRKLADEVLVENHNHSAASVPFIEFDMASLTDDASCVATSTQANWAVELQIGPHLTLRVRP